MMKTSVLSEYGDLELDQFDDAYGLRSKPTPGRSLGSSVLRASRPIREAVQSLVAESKSLAASDAIFDCTPMGAGAQREATGLRLAWLLVNATIAHAIGEGRQTLDTIEQATIWFFDSRSLADLAISSVTSAQLCEANSALSGVTVCDELRDLFPYIAEPHGHVSRACLAETSAHEVRGAKRDSGVYYTPSDVANFLVETLAAAGEIENGWLDPACGTGVFLKAIICSPNTKRDHGSADLFAFACKNLFGIDQSALATDSCAFLLLIETLTFGQMSTTPFERWKTLKRNIACMDALQLAPIGVEPSFDFGDGHRSALTDVFSHVSAGHIRHLLMNPPYASVRVDSNTRAAWTAFNGIPIGGQGEAHLAFTEMMWRLVAEGPSAAVLPLSVGANTGRAYTKLRKALISAPGTKEMLFFDREPQALFGEDIKTRNVIVIRLPSKGEGIVRTSRLLKWTAVMRPSIFSRSRLTEIDGSLCVDFVPKLETREQSHVYQMLREGAQRESQLAPLVVRRTLSALVDLDRSESSSTLVISATAYNFLNCFPASALRDLGGHPRSLSVSPTLTIDCVDAQHCFATYALLTSRIAYWLWRVEGDGFHVTGEFVRRLPIWSLLLQRSTIQSLASLGQRIWEDAAEGAVKSLNGGRTTYSFHGGHAHPSVFAAEKIILSSKSVPHSFSSILTSFIHTAVSIDGKTRRATNTRTLMQSVRQ